jgi:hypothetical protein
MGEAIEMITLHSVTNLLLIATGELSGIGTPKTGYMVEIAERSGFVRRLPQRD